MPVSKHRRKAGGKSMRRPGQHPRPRAQWVDPYADVRRAYSDVFLKKYGVEHPSGEMVDIVANSAFDIKEGETVHPVRIADAFRDFMAPIEPGGAPFPLEDAEAALALLVAEGMAEVDGDLIRVPTRFWPP